jgi:hypothetical protein
MECSIAFLIVVVFLVVIAGPLIRKQSETRRRRRAYHQLAQRFKGQYASGGLLRKPSVAFRHGATSGFVQEAKSRGPYSGLCTQIVVGWPDRKSTFDVFPAADREEMKTARRLRPLDSGDASFDAVFVVRGEQNDVRHLLSDGVRWQLTRLLKIHELPRMYVLLWRGQLIVQKPAIYRRFDDLEPLLEAALDLYDQLMLTRAEGIEFVQTDTVAAIQEVVCKVCGDEIHDHMVYCRRCKTPHHLECWRYTGQCSVFGCQEKRFVQP